MTRCMLAASVPALAFVMASVGLAAEAPRWTTSVDVQLLAPFLKQHCVSCHGSEDPQAGIRLDTLQKVIATNDQAQLWQDVLDVLNSGTMPPEDEPRPDAAVLEKVIGTLTESLFEARKMLAANGGSVTMRRLNRREYAATIRRLFGFEPPESRIVPNDDVQDFDTVGSRQHLTSDTFEQYYELGREVLATGFELAGLRQVRRATVQEPEVFVNDLFRRNLEEWKGAKGGKLAALTRYRDDYFKLPKYESGVYLAQPVRHLTYRRRIDPRGSYQIRIRAGIEGEVHPLRRFIRVERGRDGITGVFRVDGTTDAPSETVVDVTPATLGDELSGYVAEDRSGAWLSHYLKSLERIEGISANSEGLIWIDSITVDGPIYPQERSFFDTLLCPQEPEPGAKDRSPIVWNDSNARELIERFAHEAFRRRSPSPAFVDGLAAYFSKQRESGRSFDGAMIDTLAIVLASPGFVYLSEEAGSSSDPRALSPRDVGVRLAYFLTSAPPDEPLYQAIDTGEITNDQVYHDEVERLLAPGNTRRLAEGFGGQWADFVRFDGISVSAAFPTFNAGLRHSSKQEVIAFFKALIDENLPVSNLIQSDFVTINAQLATHYGIPGVTTNEFKAVKLPAGSPRGGHLTQAAFLVAGSNGERTSPTVRGMILMNRFLNSPPPPPPPNVPELGSGIEGPATTRELVALHQSRVQCASCHRKMDALGLALENFDVIGRWRSTEKTGVGSQSPIVIDGTLPDGERFASLRDFQIAMTAHQEGLARNMVESLLVYALGRDIEFTDEPAITRILDKVRPGNFRMRDMIHAVAESPLFFKN